MTEEKVIFGGDGSQDNNRSENDERSKTGGGSGFQSAANTEKPRKRYKMTEKQVQILTQTAFKEARKEASTPADTLQDHGEEVAGLTDLYFEILADKVAENVSQE